MDLLEKANSWLQEKRIQHLSQNALYIRGVEQLMVNVTPGRTDYQVEDQAGMTVKAASIDFIVAADELLFADGSDKPAAGDKIRVTRGDVITTYEVMDLGPQGCWRYCDSFNTTIRIHTREILTERIE